MQGRYVVWVDAGLCLAAWVGWWVALSHVRGENGLVSLAANGRQLMV